ncbi:hypothetical protein B0H15DRAFT_792379 [Mycena belliarum]|uniref:DUF6589 domain-containing protein n=1 Tax=Mycena belliarum TaxID=1033014 RepID=A0AAD6TNM3_9AGAR|nr:hypothetical protein B0H15DRAFT_792379 [Mycena belliae]
MAETSARTPSPQGSPPRETPSPRPAELPSSGPNPEFLPTPKKRGRPATSIKTTNTKRRKKAEGLDAQNRTAEESRLMQQKLAEAAAEKVANDLEEAVRRAEAERRARIYASLEALRNAGCTSTYQFFEDFFASTDREISRQASRLLSNHGTDLLDLMRAKRPEVVERWALKTSLPVIAAEGKKLAELLRPDTTQTYTSRLETWSMEKMVAEAAIAAPNLCELLMLMGMTSDVGRHDNKLVSPRDPDIVLVTVLCMLAQAQNERANEFQEIMGTYFLACSTPRRQFDVLAHAGLTVSYTKAISDLKGLSAEGLARLRRMVQEKACMIVWDNLNIAFKVSEQRHNSKDSFENGTTGTLIPLFGVLRGELELELLEPRLTRKHIIDYEPLDTLPRAEHIIQARRSALWHVQRILLEFFPNLGKKFDKDHGEVPVIRAIPLHKSEHFPTPALKIDESSLDGTIDVLDTTVIRTLQLDGAGMRAHGVMFAGGDLLSLSLTDKAGIHILPIPARREDTNLLDRYGAYLKGMLGLFHVKLSGTRGTLNEHWGEPNSKFPGSLWSQNTFLERKAISGGWKSKKLPPFRPAHELMLTLSLPAHILDGFRIYSGAESLDVWAESDPAWESVVSISETVVEKLCSASTVEELRLLPEADRDPQLENTILCNHDMLLLLLFTTSIKSGDVGTVLNVLAHWMVMFRGTGSMPKYADALFELINNLKRWPPALREAYLNNWLVNLTGKIRAFKEIDLLQEHQNFWAKIIYNARGSNRSWEWLSMVTVIIFNLRDVMRNVQSQFKIPHHGISHTSPQTTIDIERLKGWIEANNLQTYMKDRAGKDHILRARDLMVASAAYASTPSAFKNFRREIRKVSYKTEAAVDNQSEEEEVEEECDEEVDAFRDAPMEQDDLMHDDEEFIGMADEFLRMADEAAGIEGL